MSESLSWLAQFEGQGFEDLSALANLVLLQEMMLGEEYQMIAGSSQNLATPAAPTVTVRTAGSNETAMSATSGTYYITVTALNYFGETIASAQATRRQQRTASWTSRSPRSRARSSTTSTPPASSTVYLLVGTSVQSRGRPTPGKQTSNSVGGIKFTLQGTTPVASERRAAATDTGTGGNNRMEGLIPTLSGLSSTGAGPYANVGFESSDVWKGGYINQVSAPTSHQRDLHGAGWLVGEQRHEQRHPGRVPG